MDWKLKLKYPLQPKYGCCVDCGQTTAIDKDDICVRCLPNPGKPALDVLYVLRVLQGVQGTGVGQSLDPYHTQLRIDLQHIIDVLTVRCRKPVTLIERAKRALSRILHAD